MFLTNGEMYTHFSVIFYLVFFLMFGLWYLTFVTRPLQTALWWRCWMYSEGRHWAGLPALLNEKNL